MTALSIKVSSPNLVLMKEEETDSTYFPLLNLVGLFLNSGIA
jgi:hypothetical protein